MIAAVITTARPKPDSAAVAAVDVARAALVEDVAVRRRRRPPRPRGRGRARRHPPVRLRAPRLRRLALVGHRHPRLAAEVGHRRRDRADPRRRGDRRPAVGALPRADQAGRPVAGRPAPGRRRRPAAGPDVPRRRRPARPRREGRDPHGRPRPRPRPGPHAVPRGPRARRAALVRRRRRPGLAAGPVRAGQLHHLRLPDPHRRPALGDVRRLRQRRRQRRRPGRDVRPRLRRALRGAAGQEARAAAAARAGVRHADLGRDRAASEPERHAPTSADGSRSRRALRRRRQYSSPNSPRPNPARQVHSHHSLPASSSRP